MLIAGDLFHRQPLLRELKEMNSILEMLEHTEVVMIAGNHDYIKKNSYYRTFSWAPHVYMICSQEIDCVELDRIQTAVYGCSYHSREIHDPVYDHAVPEGRQKYEILLAHGGDEKHIPIKSNQIMTLGYDYVAITPGNYGQDFIRKTYGYDLDKSVKCSNFIGQTIDMAVELGFQKLLLTGHLGKLVKVAGGIMNTHSREADCRMEILAALAVKHEVEVENIRRVLECVTTEEAVRILSETRKMDAIMKEVVDRICYYLDKRAGGKLSIDCELYVNEFGELARSEGVEEWFILLAQDAERQI